MSVFTHLSKRLNFFWIRELSRVVAKDGLIIFTTHGDIFRDRLLRHERSRYDKGEIVVRGRITEGKRCFVAYHPNAFVREQLLDGLRVDSHLTNETLPGFSQDIWIVRNTKL